MLPSKLGEEKVPGRRAVASVSSGRSSRMSLGNAPFETGQSEVVVTRAHF